MNPTPPSPLPSQLLDDLLIGEAVEVAGSTLPNTKAWVDRGYINRPTIVGKHRRFRAHQMIELILMTELNSLGIKPSAIGDWLRMLSFGVAQYVDAHFEVQDGKFVFNEGALLRFWVTPRGCINVKEVDADDRIGSLPEQSIVLRLGPVLAAALNRARDLPRNSGHA